MKKDEVFLDHHYLAKVSGRLTVVRLFSVSPYGGWVAVNVGTNKMIRVRSAQRLRAELEPSPTGGWRRKKVAA